MPVPEEVRTPVETYAARLQAESTIVEAEDQNQLRLGNLRLLVFFLGALTVWPTVVTRAWSLEWLWIPVALFLGLAWMHARSDRRLKRASCLVGFYESGLQRLRGESPPALDDGTAYADDEHPYSTDLDLFGPGSLYGRLCTAYTQPGREALARWLRESASPEEIRSRQVAVAELSTRLDFREEVAVKASELESKITAAELDRWGGAPVQLKSRWLPRLAMVLGLANLFLAISWLSGFGDRLWLLISIGVSGVLWASVQRLTGEALASASKPANELRFLSALLERFEAESFESPRLTKLQESGETGSVDAETRPSARIGALARLIEWNDSRRNDMFLPVASLLLLGTQLAYAIERWRERNGQYVGGWLREVGEIEALGALATFCFENPGYTFPELLEGAPRLEGVGLVHPLLPPESRVANDLSLGGERQLLLVSGSNMSGKSTLMRTVGVAAVLAYAGAPVAATRLGLTPLSIGASLHVQDSLAAGVSRFYAELRRLARVRELAAAGPTLFLFDEILHGTNSHDRQVGAEGLISVLLASGAIGIVTTHDLALTRVADALAPRAVNVHFEDHLEAGKMAFDYTLKPGPVERGNALALMQSLGLHDPSEES